MKPSRLTLGLALAALLVGASISESALAHGRTRVFLGFNFGYPGYYYPAPYYYYPPYPYYYPAPVYYHSPPVSYAPAPPCRSVWTEGVWREVPRDQGGGFTAYYREWVPGQWQQVCQ